jgi:hypothetical protein
MERALIGALIFESAGVVQAQDAVAPADFESHLCREAFRAIAALYAEMGGADEKILMERLAAAGHENARAEIAAMVQAAPATQSVGDYAREVRKAAVRRRAIGRLEMLAKNAHDEADPLSIVDAMQRAAADLEAQMPGTHGDAASSAVAEYHHELDEQAAGRRQTVQLPWYHLSRESKALRPGTVCLLGGPPGTGKSFFTTLIAMRVHAQGVRWRYLPLEGRRLDFTARLYAILARDYRMIDDDQEDAEWRRNAAAPHDHKVAQMEQYVSENPRTGCRDARGRTIVPPLPYTDVLLWIQEHIDKGAQVLFVDPVSQIEFEGRRSYEVEARFVRKLIALATDSGALIFLVAHTVKRPGKNASVELSLEDLQGSAMFGRLCQAAMLLSAHDTRESKVWRTGGIPQEVEHNRTVLIAKARFGAGTGKRIAFVQDSEAPHFEELGVIAPKGVEGVPF